MAKKRKAKASRRAKKRVVKRKKSQGILDKAKKSLSNAVDVVVGAAQDTEKMRRKMKRRVGLGEG